MTDPDGQGLRPGTPYGGDPGDEPRPLSPRCPNTDRPAWLYWGYHCQQDANLRRKFGITCEDYQELLEAQGGRCGGCDGAPKKRALAVDHDYETNEIRGLLCTHCNQALTRGLARYILDPPAPKVRPFIIPPDRVEAMARIRRQNAESMKRARAAKRAKARANSEPFPDTADEFLARTQAALEATRRNNQKGS